MTKSAAAAAAKLERTMSQDETLRDVLTYTVGGGIVSAAEGAIVRPRQPRSPLAPPAPMIGVVWSALFAAFGVARGRLRGHPREQRAIDGLWLLCATYPLYTGGQRWHGAAYAGNAAIAAAATAIAVRTIPKDPDAARLVSLVVPWVAWATLALLTERPRGGESASTLRAPAPRRVGVGAAGTRRP